MNLPDLKKARIRTKEKSEYIYDKALKQTDIFSNKKYFIRTYGCQMNVHDTEEIKARVETLGFVETEDYKVADLIILNTCAIRENAHDKVFGFLGRCKHIKQTKKNLIIAVGGCMSQEESVAEEIIKKHPYIDIVFGTHNINEITDLILKKQEEQLIEVYSYEGKVIENAIYKRDSKIKAWVNIMYGCDKFCTYCIVPFTRGKQRSRKLEDIVLEVENLVKEGYKEVTLLGQNVNAYGKDLENPTSLAICLEEVSKTGIDRIRFVTSHPWDFTHTMIEIISKYNNIMPYIHLPIQSGSNNILKNMNRRYTKEEYIRLFNSIKDSVPNVAITTDIIVGFPNETEEDFNETLDVIESLKFDGAFTFIYSPREGTLASKIKDNVSKEIKEERLQKLNKLVNKYSLENNKKYLNQIVPVLIEGISEKDDTKVFGYTDTMKLVNIVGDKELIGSIVNVRITDAKSFSLDGVVAQKKDLQTS